jgi:hypothetical protein
MAGQGQKGRELERLFIHCYLQPWEEFAASALKKRRAPSGMNGAESGEEQNDVLGSK